MSNSFTADETEHIQETILKLMQNLKQRRKFKAKNSSGNKMKEKMLKKIGGNEKFKNKRLKKIEKKRLKKRKDK